MKKIGISALLAGGLATAVLGFAAPASAGVDRHLWLDQIHPKATAPQVDNTVRHTSINTSSINVGR